MNSSVCTSTPMTSQSENVSPTTPQSLPAASPLLAQPPLCSPLLPPHLVELPPSCPPLLLSYLKLPPPPPLLPPPLIGPSIGCSRRLTSPVGRITTEISSQTLGHKAYNIFCDKRPDTSHSDKYCFISFYQPVEPILQNGPLCGVVALAMSAARLDRSDVTVEDLFNRSRELKLSKQGEIFSVDYMVDLARDVLQCCAEIIDVRQEDGRKELVKKLLQGAVLLIPYDADKNHHPCQKKGHKAHWALITGFFLVLDIAMEPSIQSLCTADTEQPGLYHCTNMSVLNIQQSELDPHQSKLDLQQSELDPQQSELDLQSVVDLWQSVVSVVVYGQQGKSKYPGVWCLDDLLHSNTNLTEVDPERTAEFYVIPAGGVLEGLCGRIVVLTTAKD